MAGVYRKWRYESWTGATDGWTGANCKCELERNCSCTTSAPPAVRGTGRTTRRKDARRCR